MKFIWKDGYIDFRDVPYPPIKFYRRFEHDREDRKDKVFRASFHDNSSFDVELSVVTFQLFEHYDEFRKYCGCEYKEI